MANHAATDLAQRLGEIVGDVGDGHADMQMPVALQAHTPRWRGTPFRCVTSRIRLI